MADLVLCDRLFLLKTVLSDINLEPVNSEMTVEDTNTPTKKDNPNWKSVKSEGSSQTGQTKNNNMTPSSSASANSDLFIHSFIHSFISFI